MSLRKSSDIRFINAARSGRLEDIIRLSSKFNRDVKWLSEALYWSCWYGHLDVVKWLVEHTAANVNYNTPLPVACYFDYLDVVKHLVKTYHANSNVIDRAGNTPLIEACFWNRMSVSMYLLREVSCLNVNIVNIKGNTALHLAVWCSKDDGYTKLHKACDFKSDAFEMLKLVYVYGHKINVQNNFGNTPLHLACYNGHSDIVEALMLAGADETITNDDGKTALQLAEQKGHSAVRKLLSRDSLQRKMMQQKDILYKSVKSLKKNSSLKQNKKEKCVQQ